MHNYYNWVVEFTQYMQCLLQSPLKKSSFSFGLNFKFFRFVLFQNQKIFIKQLFFTWIKALFCVKGFTKTMLLFLTGITKTAIAKEFILYITWLVNFFLDQNVSKNYHTQTYASIVATNFVSCRISFVK